MKVVCSNVSQTRRVLKLTTLLLLAFLMQVAAKGYSQKITLSVKNVSLEKVFELIKNQTGYHFLYNNEQMKRARPISLSVKEASLESVLIACFKDQPFAYTVVDQLIVVREKQNDATGPQSKGGDSSGGDLPI